MANLILLHGWGLNGAIWNPLLPKLRKQFNVTVIDLPGYRNQPLPKNGSLESFARQILDHAPKPAIWVGWSLGGQIALQAAQIASPTLEQRISGLFLVATTPSFIQRKDWDFAVTQSVLDNFHKGLLNNREKEIHRFLTLQMQGVENARPLIRSLKEELAQPPAHNALEAGLKILSETDLRPILPKIDLPTVWWMGERDPLVPTQAGEWAAAQNQNAHCEIVPKAGHAPFLSHPDLFLAGLEKFSDVA